MKMFNLLFRGLTEGSVEMWLHGHIKMIKMAIQIKEDRCF